MHVGYFGRCGQRPYDDRIKKIRFVHFPHIDQNLLVIRRVGAKPDSPISAQRAENITPYIAYFG